MIYKLLEAGVMRSDGAVVPFDINNSDYQAYLAWIEAGNIPDAADPSPDIVSISIDSNLIIGDGIDEITIKVQGKANRVVTLDVLTGNTPSTVNISLDENGSGSQVFSCETSPTVIVFSFGDINLKVRAL